MELSKRLKLATREVEGAHIMHHVECGCAAYDTLCLICSELNIDISNTSDQEFSRCAKKLGDYLRNLQRSVTVNRSNIIVSAWFV